MLDSLGRRGRGVYCRVGDERSEEIQNGTAADSETNCSDTPGSAPKVSLALSSLLSFLPPSFPSTFLNMAVTLGSDIMGALA